MIYQKGFTLIETIIYIALFTILIVGGFVTAYQLIQGSDTLNAKTITQEEGNFVLRKMDWALTGLDSGNPPVVVPSVSGCEDTLKVYKYSYTNNPIEFSRNTASSTIEMREAFGVNIPITTSNASTTCLKFSLIAGTPSGITATTTINSIDFTITKYIRK